MTRRERQVLAGGALAAALLIAILLRPDARRTDPAPVAAPPPTPAEAPVAIPGTPPAQSPDAAGLTLHGINHGAAVIGYPGGRQRLVRTGRPVLPGLVLGATARDHVLLEGAGGAVRLSFADGPVPVAPDAPAPAAPASPATAGADDRLGYRLAFTPRREDGRITGFTLRDGAMPPLLARAGLRPGDTLLSVNGQAFASEERVMELAYDVASSARSEFVFERGGERMTRILDVDPAR